jgi:hypothetical protein
MKPKSVEGQCNAWLIVSDDYGDNDCTFRCNLDSGHSGDHLEEFKMTGKDGEEDPRPVKVSWAWDDKPEYEATMARILKDENEIMEEFKKGVQGEGASKRD